MDASTLEAVAVAGATGVALYAGHHVGDYWVQTDHQAAHKGDPGPEGAWQCLAHVATYTATQAVALLLLVAATGLDIGWGIWPALALSAGTHYLADRRDQGPMFKLARWLKGGDFPFLHLGVPRAPRELELWGPCPSCEGRGSGGSAADESTNGMCWDCRAGGQLPHTVTLTDNPSLGTGKWALDQSWHIWLGVFLPALVLALFTRLGW